MGNVGFNKAIRDNIFAKVFMIAPSGGGKSYSALRMAKGMAERLSEVNNTKERIAYIGTEGSRDKYYADEFDYDLLQIKNNFAPENYVDAIDEAIDAGYKIVVIDSMSHEWAGKGGCLEIHSKMAGNSYTNWQKVTPRHDKFMDKVLDSELFIVGTIRGKDKYVLEEENGKSVPRKVNLGYQQRDDTEYIATLSIQLEQETHLYNAVKDNTHLFEGQNAIVTEKDGRSIIDWCTGGDIKSKKAELQKSKQEAMNKIKSNEENEAEELEKEAQKKRKTITKDNSLETVKKQIMEFCKALSQDGKKDAVAIILTDIAGTPNPMKIEDIDIAERALESLSKL